MYKHKHCSIKIALNVQTHSTVMLCPPPMPWQGRRRGGRKITTRVRSFSKHTYFWQESLYHMARRRQGSLIPPTLGSSGIHSHSSMTLSTGMMPRGSSCHLVNIILVGIHVSRKNTSENLARNRKVKYVIKIKLSYQTFSTFQSR